MWGLWQQVGELRRENEGLRCQVGDLRREVAAARENASINEKRLREALEDLLRSLRDVDMLCFDRSEIDEARRKARMVLKGNL